MTNKRIQKQDPGIALLSSTHEAGREESAPLIVPLTKREEAAISEYARLCGESIPDLVRKMLIREVTLADGHGSDDPLCDYAIKLPPGLSLNEQRKLLEEGYNRIRALLGWRSIKL